MTTFEDKLSEIYLNYDTISMMKNDIPDEEIHQIFNSDLSYSKNLINSLINIDNNHLKSCMIRLKFIKDKSNSDILVNKLNKCNKYFKDITDYLLDDSEVDDDEVDEVEENGEDDADEGDVEDDVEDDGEEECGDEGEGEEDDEVEEKTDEELVNDFLNFSISKTESENDELTLGDIYQKYSEYCESKKYDCIDTSSFKKFLKSKYGKPEGKGDNAKYKYLNYI